MNPTAPTPSRFPMAVSQTATVWPRKGTFILTAVSRSPDALFMWSLKKDDSPLKKRKKKSIVDTKRGKPMRGLQFFIFLVLDREYISVAVWDTLLMSSSASGAPETYSVPPWIPYNTIQVTIMYLGKLPYNQKRKKTKRKKVHSSLIIMNVPK